MGKSMIHKEVTLEETLILAAKAHEKQVDKARKPYILHPIRVMMEFSDDVEMKVALLHDVLEDTKVTYEELKELGFSDAILEAVLALTRRKEETYEDFIFRAKQNSTARKVKLADLKDNMDLGRISDPQEADFERLKKYRVAAGVLLED